MAAAGDQGEVDGIVDKPAGGKRRKLAKFSWDTASRLARRHRHLRGLVLQLVRELVAAVEQKRGSPPTLLERKIIADAARHECAARLCEQRLAKEPDCSTSDLVSLLNRIAQATDASTRAIQRLGLDTPASEVLLQRLYGKRRDRPPTINGRATEGAKPSPGPSSATGPPIASHESGQNYGAQRAPQDEEPQP